MKVVAVLEELASPDTYAFHPETPGAYAYLKHNIRGIYSMTEEQKELSGMIFNPRNPQLKAIKRIAHNLCVDYNKTYEDEVETRSEILGKLLKEKGENVYFQGPIYFNYGTHTAIGDGFFGNYNICISDDAAVTIGAHVMFGPNCTLVTPEHPLMADERRYMKDDIGELFGPCYAKYGNSFMSKGG